MTRLLSRLATALLLPALVLGLASDSHAAPKGTSPIKPSKPKGGRTSGNTTQTSLGTADLVNTTDTSGGFSPASLDDEEEEQLRQQWGAPMP